VVEERRNEEGERGENVLCVMENREGRWRKEKKEEESRRCGCSACDIEGRRKKREKEEGRGVGLLGFG
jgi:hypothetical protein